MDEERRRKMADEVGDAVFLWELGCKGEAGKIEL